MRLFGVVVDHARAAALTHALARPANLAKPTRSWDHISGQGVGCNPRNELLPFGIVPDAACIALENLGFDDCSHVMNIRHCRMAGKLDGEMGRDQAVLALDCASRLAGRSWNIGRNPFRFA